MLIETVKLSKLYSRGVYALRDLSLKVDKGEFLFLTGPSGAGEIDLSASAASRGTFRAKGADRRRPRISRDLSPRRGAGLPPIGRLRLPGLQADSAMHRAFENVAFVHARARRRAARSAAKDVPGAQVGRPAASDERAVRRALGRRAAAHRDRPGASSTIRRSSWPTSRPATSIPTCRSKS